MQGKYKTLLKFLCRRRLKRFIWILKLIFFFSIHLNRTIELKITNLELLVSSFSEVFGILTSNSSLVCLQTYTPLHLNLVNTPSHWMIASLPHQHTPPAKPFLVLFCFPTHKLAHSRKCRFFTKFRHCCVFACVCV